MGGADGPTERSGRLRRLGKWIRDHYLVADPRTLGFFRLVLGFLVTADCLRHWHEARWAYSNSGVLTNHYQLFRPSSGYCFSLYHAFSSIEEVHVAFALSVFCFFCFWIGWRTRLFSVISFVLVTSLDNRLVMVENGGYVVVNLLVGWAMFMPTGRRFSVDALLRSYREKKERTAADLDARARPPWMTEPFVSGIVLVALLNLAAVYFFNVVNKSGAIWKSGQTVHYVLHLDRMVTGIAVFFREHLPFWTTRALTWAVLALEALLVPWILAPSGRRVTRVLAMLGIWALHTTFGVMMRLGPFAWFLIGWSFLLLLPEHWDALERWYRRRAEARVVAYDRSSPLAFAIARLLARLDLLDLLRFEEAAPGGALFAVRSAAAGGSDATGVTAFGEIAQALPGGRYWRWLAPVATLGLLGPILGAVSRRRVEIARFFGLTVPPRGREERAAVSPLTRAAARVRSAAREAAIAFLGVCAVSQAINENKSVPESIPIGRALAAALHRWVAVPPRVAAYAIPLKHQQPKIMEAAIQYPRMFQGWGMFAPNPITDDGTLAVDAITIAGRHVDPFTGEAPDLDLTDARGLGLGQIRQDYFNRIRLDRNKAYRQGLRDYLMRYHLETGRREDELVAFDVYWVRDQCPPPGSLSPYKNERIAILTWRKPGYVPPPGQAPLPPAPKEESAGN